MSQFGASDRRVLTRVAVLPRGECHPQEALERACYLSAIIAGSSYAAPEPESAVRNADHPSPDRLLRPCSKSTKVSPGQSFFCSSSRVRISPGTVHRTCGVAAGFIFGRVGTAPIPTHTAYYWGMRYPIVCRVAAVSVCNPWAPDYV